LPHIPTSISIRWGTIDDSYSRGRNLHLRDESLKFV
jgi:hypothetical protein